MLQSNIILCASAWRPSFITRRESSGVAQALIVTMRVPIVAVVAA